MSDHRACDLLLSVYVLLEAGSRLVLQRFGLTAAQFHVLRLLDSTEGRRPGDLAARLLVDKSRLTRVVDDLEHAGLVHRRTDPDDRRAQQVVLTQEGVRRRDAAHAAHEDSIAQRLGVLAPDDHQFLSRVLERLRAHMQTELAHDR